MTVLTLEPGLPDLDAEALAQALVRALEALPPGRLPLAAACTQGGVVDDGDLAISVLAVSEAAERVTARVGVFFSEVVGGCNCDEDPVAFPAYGVLRVVLDRRCGVAVVAPDDD